MTLGVEWWTVALPLLGTVIGGVIVWLSNWFLDTKREKREDARRARSELREEQARLRVLHDDVSSMAARHQNKVLTYKAHYLAFHKRPSAHIPSGLTDAVIAATASSEQLVVSMMPGTFLAPTAFLVACRNLTDASALPDPSADDADWQAWTDQFIQGRVDWAEALTEWLRSLATGPTA